MTRTQRISTAAGYRDGYDLLDNADAAPSASPLSIAEREANRPHVAGLDRRAYVPAFVAGLTARLRESA